MPEPTAIHPMPTLVKSALLQAGVDLDDVADWKVETNLTERDAQISVLLKPETSETVEITVVKDSDA